MKTFGLLGMTVLVLVVQTCFGQELGEDVENLALTEVSPTVSRLSWTGPKSVECQVAVTYSVFRGTREDFTPSVRNRIASGLTKMTYVVKEQVVGKDYYYYVKAYVTGITCELHSGLVMAYPLPSSKFYAVTVGDLTENCMSWSATELDCTLPTRKDESYTKTADANALSGLLVFHALIAAQANQEYLIGCESYNYEGGNWTCEDLSPGHWYTVVVHEGTVSVVDSGISRINIQTGKSVGAISPVFTILTRTK
jgi:hypothetical protein